MERWNQNHNNRCPFYLDWGALRKRNKGQQLSPVHLLRFTIDHPSLVMGWRQSQEKPLRPTRASLPAFPRHVTKLSPPLPGCRPRHR